MTDLAHHAPAAVIAAAGATCTALATAVQQRAARRAPRRRGLAPGLVRDLLRSRQWLLSWLGLALGYSCYLLALSMAPLVLVQPILLVGLVLGSLFAARLARRTPDRRLIAGSLLCLAGLSGLLLAARPGAGTYFPVPVDAAAGVTGIVVGAGVLAALVGRRFPAWGFAIATGALWGTTAALAKLVLAQLARGWTEPLTHWPLYGLLVTAPLGFLFSQRAFQLSALLAPVNAVISVLDPVIATAIGVLVLGEHTAPGPGSLALQATAAFAALAGVGIVGRRSTQLARAAARADDRTVTWG